ncbi:uncharacterized protein SPPG_02096 [Spizellomyces punctatus DAOM BR117]|uniref:Uncharacterized protein n=1 Tax=Spizellomyces punctatus (strain DAOM BR117) TaxID=645134 RepID=A0A0L0HNL7_SPIPD|nr:uncharacterized protein SPPG_02096 [Spizellomyces punctatus DAOM BR117]KND03026.1 hypothetical protein SPPG_02096 [Spizellomyces punctatus DAOM BR117]|eukprot:XP_016611065.1 hypothetical protein SPPG_02096 [Spizellomyces punctatus DAOM BR117]
MDHAQNTPWQQTSASQTPSSSAASPFGGIMSTMTPYGAPTSVQALLSAQRNVLSSAPPNQPPQSQQFYTYQLHPQPLQYLVPSTLSGANSSVSFPVTITTPYENSSTYLRKKFSPEQTDFMRKKFDENPKPSDQIYKEISQTVGLSEKQVKDWFVRERTKKKNANNAVSMPTPAATPVTIPAPSAIASSFGPTVTNPMSLGHFPFNPSATTTYNPIVPNTPVGVSVAQPVANAPFISAVAAQYTPSSSIPTVPHPSAIASSSTSNSSLAAPTVNAYEAYTPLGTTSQNTTVAAPTSSTNVSMSAPMPSGNSVYPTYSAFPVAAASANMNVVPATNATHVSTISPQSVNTSAVPTDGNLVLPSGMTVSVNSPSTNPILPYSIPAATNSVDVDFKSRVAQLLETHKYLQERHGCNLPFSAMYPSLWASALPSTFSGAQSMPPNNSMPGSLNGWQTTGVQPSARETNATEVARSEPLETETFQLPEDGGMRADSPVSEDEGSGETLLAPFLTEDGQVKDNSSAQTLAKQLARATVWQERIPILNAFEKTSNKEVFASFLKRQGLKTMTKMLLKAKDTIHENNVATCAIVALKVLLKLPVELSDLREMKTGKLVKYFASIDAGMQSPAVHDAAGSVMRSWQALIGKASADKADEKKRIRDDSSGGAAKKTKVVDGPKKAPAEADRKVVQAVDNFDIFKSLSHAALPKIKKAEKPVAANSDAPVSTESVKETTPVDDMAESSPTSTANSSLLIDADKIPSYRSTNEKSEETPASVNEAKPKKKRVRFAEADKLVSVRYFEKFEPTQEEEREAFNITPHERGNARDFDRQEGHRAFRRELIASRDWVAPSVISWPVSYEWGRDSTEATAQQDRVRGILSATYFSEDQIPYSPAEPPEEQETSAVIPPRIILVDDQQSVNPTLDVAGQATDPNVAMNLGTSNLDVSGLLNALSSQQPSVLGAIAGLPAQNVAPVPNQMDLGTTLLSALSSLSMPSALPQASLQPDPNAPINAQAILIQSLLSQLGGQNAVSPASIPNPVGLPLSSSQTEQPHQQRQLLNSLTSQFGQNSTQSLSQHVQPQQQNQGQNGRPNSRWGPRGGQPDSMHRSHRGGHRPGPYERPDRGRGGIQQGRGRGGVINHRARGTKSCFFYTQGYCRAGEACTFRHDVPPASEGGT